MEENGPADNVTCPSGTEENPGVPVSDQSLSLNDSNSDQNDSSTPSQNTYDVHSSRSTLEEEEDDDEDEDFSVHDSHSDTVLVEGGGDPEEEDDTDEEEMEVDKKEIETIIGKGNAKSDWKIVPQLVNREIAYGRNHRSPLQFRERCYGSLMNVEKLELMYKLEEHEGCVNCLSFSSDGHLLASGSDDLKLVIWDWKFGKKVVAVDTEHKRNIFQTKFLNLKGPDMNLMTCGRDGQVNYMQLGPEGKRSSRKIGQHRGACHKLALLAEQPQVALSAGEDGIVFCNDIRKQRAERVIHVKRDERELPLFSIHSHPLNPYEFCVAGREAAVRVYDQRKCQLPLAKFCSTNAAESNRLNITCAVYNYDGTEILASYSDDDIYLFDATRPNEKYIHKYSGHRNTETVKGVSFFGPRSEFVVSGSDCAHIFFWDKKSEAIVQFLLADDTGVVNCLEPHPEFPFLATSGLDWDVKLWVPSCEQEPDFSSLVDTIKNNRSLWNRGGINPENHLLYLMWRRLRHRRPRTERPGSQRRTANWETINWSAQDDGSSDSSLSSGSDVSVTNCTTS